MTDIHQQQEDPCLSAFEEWMQDRRIRAEKNTDWGNGIFKDKRVEAMWEGFICAWGIRQQEIDRLRSTPPDAGASERELDWVFDTVEGMKMFGNGHSFPLIFRTHIVAPSGLAETHLRLGYMTQSASLSLRAVFLSSPIVTLWSAGISFRCQRATA